MVAWIQLSSSQKRRLKLYLTFSLRLKLCVWFSHCDFFFPVLFSVSAKQHIQPASCLMSSWFIPGGFLQVKDERLFLAPTGIRKKLSIMPRFKPQDKNLRLWMTSNLKQQYVIKGIPLPQDSCLSVLQECRAVICGPFLVFSEVQNSKKDKTLLFFHAEEEDSGADEGLRAKCCGCH